MTELTPSSKIKYNNLRQEELNYEFIEACKRGDLPLVMYLLTSHELIKHADIHAEYTDDLNQAAKNAHLEIVQYLLLSSLSKAVHNFNKYKKTGFTYACENEHLKVVEYLLSFTNDRYIKFQESNHNLDWAISQKYHTIVKSMTLSLYKNDMMIYVENLSKVEQYCQEHGLNFQEWQEEMIDKDKTNYSEMTELFI